MRIYSDTLTANDLRTTARQVPGLYIDELKALNKPRVRTNGFLLQTSGNTNRYRNSGTYGADTNANAASWDQHGQWFNLLYTLDPNARIAFYDNAQDFHTKTKNKYRQPTPMATP